MIRNLNIFVLLGFILIVPVLADPTYKELNDQATKIMFDDPQRAEQLLKQAKEIMPAEPLAYLNMGNALLLFKQDRTEEASQEFKRALALCRTRQQLKFCITGIEIATQIFWKDGTKELYDKAIKLINQKKSGEAVALLEKALSINPKNALLYYEIGYTNIELGEITKAIEFLEKGRRLNPTSKKILKELIFCYSERGDLENLRQVIEKLEFLHGDDPSLRNELAFAYSEAGKIDSAIVVYEQVLQKFPDSYFSAYFLAELLYKEKRDQARVCELMKFFLQGVEGKTFKDYKIITVDGNLDKMRAEARKIIKKCQE